MTPTLMDVIRVRRLSVWTNPKNEKRPYVPSFCIAIGVHLFLILAGSIAFVKPAEYGIELSQSSIELSLIAALPKEMQRGTQVENVLDENKAEMTMTTAETKVKGNEESKSQLDRLEKSKDENSGDGSSAEPGKSKTTFYSAGGGSVDEKAGYLKNPPPSYPREAVEKGQEGVVMLAAVIDRTGKPKKIEIRKSSGYSLLDESALKAVKKWKFRPASLGFLAAESELLIPVRFQLKDVKR